MSFAKIDVGDSGCIFIEHRPVFRRRGDTVEGFGNELCNDESVTVPKGAGQVGNEPQEPSGFPNPLRECGASPSSGEVKVSSQVSMLMDDFERGLSLAGKSDGCKAVASLLVRGERSRVVGPDFTAEGTEVLKSGAH